LIGLMFLLSLAVTTSYGEGGKYWRGDNGRHVGWYNNDRPRRSRWRGRYIRRYRPVTWYTYGYYPRVIRYRTYPRYYTTYYPAYYGTEYVEYPRYRTYRRYPRSGVNVNLSFRW
jgi:hypothetical protein